MLVNGNAFGFLDTRTSSNKQDTRLYIGIEEERKERKREKHTVKTTYDLVY
jgi:hypothetical protein